MKAQTAFWLATGAFIAAAVMPSCLMAQTVPTPPPVAFSQDIAFGRFIALIRGHLLTGDELVGKLEWDAARSHFSFPAEEIYGIIRAELKNYQTPPFDGALKTLVNTVRAHSAKQYPKALQKVEDALAAADAGLKAKVPNWPHFEVEVAIAVLKSALDEYDDAVAKGKIVHPIGYQTARGFILQSDRMFESVAGDFASENAAPLAEIRAGFAQLRQVFANVNAPKLAVLDYSAVLGIVSKIELAAGKLK